MITRMRNLYHILDADETFFTHSGAHPMLVSLEFLRLKYPAVLAVAPADSVFAVLVWPCLSQPIEQCLTILINTNAKRECPLFSQIVKKQLL